MTRAEQKKAGHELYLLNVPSADIARILGVTPATVSNWTVDGDWKAQRVQVMAKKASRIDMLADLIDFQLECMTALMDEKRVTAKKEGTRPIEIDKGQIDALVKMFSAIKGKEVTWASVVDIIREFNAFLLDKSPDLAKQLVPFSDEFLYTKREHLTAR